MIHGHIHLYDLQATRCTISENTTVINAYSHIVIEFEPNLKKGANFGADVSILADR